MTVILTKLSDNENALRTPHVRGFAPAAPVVGQSFNMWSEALEAEGGVRYIRTSPVQEITDTGFRTLNTLYRLDVLADEMVGS